MQELDDIKDGKDNHQPEQTKNEKLYSLDDIFNLDPELFENKVFVLLINQEQPNKNSIFSVNSLKKSKKKLNQKTKTT